MDYFNIEPGEGYAVQMQLDLKHHGTNQWQTIYSTRPKESDVPSESRNLLDSLEDARSALTVLKKTSKNPLRILHCVVTVIEQ